MFGRILLCVIALGAGACVKQGQVRERPVLDLYHLCSDAQARSLCTPAPNERPVQIDTNLAVPRPASSPALG